MTDVSLLSFWEYHGVIFIFFMALFPRLTMLFATTLGGGFLYWLGWLLCPRIVVAIIATAQFFDTNPVLVVLTWIWAMGGTAGETTVAGKAIK